VGIASLVANVFVAFVALLHVGFFVLESFLWTKPAGRRIFGLTAEKAHDSAALAANQGVYNLFVASGLIWGLVAHDGAFAIKVFFLTFVIIAGIVGAITAKRSILFVQGLPGAIALLLVVFTQR
jgi:putative membrane protein